MSGRPAKNTTQENERLANWHDNIVRGLKKSISSGFEPELKKWRLKQALESHLTARGLRQVCKEEEIERL